MTFRTFILASAATFGCLSNSDAATFNYDFSGSGSWSDSSRWKEGGKPGSSDDQIRIGSGTVVASNGDLEVLKNVGTVVLTQSDTVLVISNDSAFALSTYIAGEGRVVKEGVGTLTVAAVYKDSQKYPFSNPGGWDVRYGDLAIDNPSAFSPVRISVPLAVHAPGRIVFGFSGSNLQIKSLAGDGTIVNVNEEARIISNWTSPIGNVPCTFSGTVVGKFKYRSSESSAQCFWGSGCDVLSSSVELYGGYLGADVLPASGIVVREKNNSKFEYIGTEVVSGSNSKVWLNNNAHAVEFSAGSTGGCTVNYSFVNPGDNLTMDKLTLSGNNARTAVFNGSFDMDGGRNLDADKKLACYLKKTGTGTWRFTASNKANRGTVAVEKGTLEYESMAEKGTSCSLGNASILHSEYTGARDDSKAVGYAYLLGDGAIAAAGDNTVATMKYVGDSKVSITGRTVAVKGSGRFASASAPIHWSGFTSAVSGDNEVVLAGDASDCRAYCVTNGIGKMSVVKEGAGDWTVEGEFDFSGAVEAREGVLKINASKNYGWYKLVLKENWRAETSGGDGSIIWISQFGLFDADGKNWIENLVHNKSANGMVKDLKPGEAAFGHANFNYHSSNAELWSLTNAFNSANTAVAGNRGKSFSPANNTLADPSAWVEIVVRPHETTNALVRYDIRQYSCSNVSWLKDVFARDVRSWSLEGSMDGINWENLDTVISNKNPTTGDQCKWIGTNRTTPHNAGEGLGPIAAETSRALLRPSSVASVSAASGATVKVNAALPTAKIKVDYALGGGTIEGFALAKNGALEVVNVPEDAGRSLLIPLSLVNVSGAENISGYTVLVNGKNKSWSCRYSDGYLKVDAPGTVILFR